MLPCARKKNKMVLCEKLLLVRLYLFLFCYCQLILSSDIKTWFHFLLLHCRRRSDFIFHVLFFPFILLKCPCIMSWIPLNIQRSLVTNLLVFSDITLRVSLHTVTYCAAICRVADLNTHSLTFSPSGPWPPSTGGFPFLTIHSFLMVRRSLASWSVNSYFIPNTISIPGHILLTHVTSILAPAPARTICCCLFIG